MKILIVKLSSLGDVVHAMPAVQDLVRMRPNATIDWVVERGFAPLVSRCQGVRRTIPAELRKWRKSLLSPRTRAEWGAFRAELRAEAYDAIVDLQGLTKSAVVSRMARLSPGGRRIAMANRTEGSSYEPPTRWAADVAITMEPHIHAVQRSRELCAQAFGYSVPATLRYGLRPDSQLRGTRDIVFVHGSSRDDKGWPEANWIELGRELTAEGYCIGLPQGSDAEEARARTIAAALGPTAQVWPRVQLDALLDHMGSATGVIGVDSGLSHIAVALGLPHVQIYNFDTAWRTGPLGDPAQESVFGQPTPDVPSVAQAWRRVSRAR